MKTKPTTNPIIFRPDEQFIFTSYIRAHKKKYGTDSIHAEIAFDLALKQGLIEEVKEWNGIKIYKQK